MAELERLGDTDEWGSLLVRLVTLDGWRVTRRPRLADGVLLIGIGYGIAVIAAGDTLADAAWELFDRAMTIKKRKAPRAA